MNVPAQRIILAGIVGLFPMLVYCLLLIGLNSRRRASMIPGPWDFAGVLLATSGFLLGGGPMILAGLNGSWRRYLLHGRVADWRTLSGEGNVLALAAWAGFFVFVVAACAFLISRRRHVTVLYNVDVPHFAAALEWVFGRLAIVWKKTDRGYELLKAHESGRRPWRPALPIQPGAEIPPRPEIEPRPTPAWLVVQPLPGSCNVTLQWHGDYHDLRRKVEGEMQQLLVNMRPDENPMLNWVLSVAMILFGVIAASMVFVVLTTVKFRNAFGMI
ncbi:MAG: hypothetical protein K1X57_02450 [Gemmataceae bacterium]|nr:hypothetical protein [Gemmataceae bacterium]